MKKKKAEFRQMDMGALIDVLWEESLLNDQQTPPVNFLIQEVIESLKDGMVGECIEQNLKSQFLDKLEWDEDCYEYKLFNSILQDIMKVMMIRGAEIAINKSAVVFALTKFLFQHTEEKVKKDVKKNNKKQAEYDKSVKELESYFMDYNKESITNIIKDSLEFDGDGNPYRKSLILNVCDEMERRSEVLEETFKILKSKFPGQDEFVYSYLFHVLKGLYLYGGEVVFKVLDEFINGLSERRFFDMDRDKSDKVKLH